MNIIKNRYLYFLISLLVIIPGLVFLLLNWNKTGKPLPLGIDFTDRHASRRFGSTRCGSDFGILPRLGSRCLVPHGPVDRDRFLRPRHDRGIRPHSRKFPCLSPRGLRNSGQSFYCANTRPFHQHPIDSYVHTVRAGPLWRFEHPSFCDHPLSGYFQRYVLFDFQRLPDPCGLAEPRMEELVPAPQSSRSIIKKKGNAPQ